MYRTLATCVFTLALCTACMSATEHRADVRDDATEHLTLGAVQREIRVGMSGDEVVRVLGAPNVVTTDDERREVWIYDKVATETVHSSSSGGVAALVLGWSASVAGGPGGSLSRSAGAVTRTQRTLTIAVQMGADGRVRDFSYRASQF